MTLLPHAPQPKGSAVSGEGGNERTEKGKGKRESGSDDVLCLPHHIHHPQTSHLKITMCRPEDCHRMGKKGGRVLVVNGERNENSMY